MRGIVPAALLIAAVVAMIGVAAVVAIARSRAAVRRTGALAAALGLARVSSSPIGFYAGTYAGHPVALAHVYVREALGGEDGRRGGHWALRMAVGLRSSLGYMVYRPSPRLFQAAMSGSFEADFQTREAARIGAGPRESLSRFAYAHGHLSLSDRRPAGKLLGGGAVLADCQAVLVHDEAGLDQPPDQVARVIDAMIAAVAPMERGTAHRDDLAK